MVLEPLSFFFNPSFLLSHISALSIGPLTDFLDMVSLQRTELEATDKFLRGCFVIFYVLGIYFMDFVICTNFIMKA
ncbi:hypothetical protein K1719_039545 [Acacia pycnantha]|nr:hypothetical protein K1719_039545 [Acacia pycnantha]